MDPGLRWITHLSYPSSTIRKKSYRVNNTNIAAGLATDLRLILVVAWKAMPMIVSIDCRCWTWLTSKGQIGYNTL